MNLILEKYAKFLIKIQGLILIFKILLMKTEIKFIGNQSIYNYITSNLNQNRVYNITTIYYILNLKHSNSF